MSGCLIAIIDDVRLHGENLSIVTVEGNEVVANLGDDGLPRWKVGEACVYIPEGMIVPEDVLKERGYWNDERGKGLLEGKKGNRVKMRRFAGHESRGLIFKTEPMDLDFTHIVSRGSANIAGLIGSDMSEFLGIAPHVG